MDAHHELDGVHGFPLEKRAPEPDDYWPLSMDTPTLLRTAKPTGVIMQRADDTATASKGSSTCEPDNNAGICAKPASASGMTLPIVLGVTIPLVGAFLALIILHRRHVRKQREEDANDRHASLDFGLGNASRKQGKKGGQEKSSDINMEEKPGHRPYGMSLDIINSPYLLPPGLSGSRESLHSLSRSGSNQEDPYRPTTASGNGGGSMYGDRKHGGSSVYTGHTGHTGNSTIQESVNAGLVGNAGQMGRAAPSENFVPPPRQGSLPQYPLSPIDTVSPIEPAYFPKSPSISGGVQRNGQSPNSKDAGGLLPGSPQDPRESYAGQDAAGLRLSNNYLGSFISGSPRTETPPPITPSRETTKSPFLDSAALLEMPRAPNSPDQAGAYPQSTPAPPRQASLPHSQPTGPLPQIPQVSVQQNWNDNDYDANDGFMVTPPSPTRQAEMKRASRYSMDVPPEEYANAGLGAPGVDPRRISMGFRPLPPTLAVESDDPEIRANRIRSFYKEYFDDSKPAPQGEYYEDYDNGAYHGQGNNNVRPYAEPMARRAMTPPPGAGRFMGQQQPPRAMHGSLAQNNFGPGPGHPRAVHGSVSSGNQWRGPPGFQEPRPFSSASNQRGGTPAPRGRPIPPPQDLSTMPTPALLKDDSFALFNAAEFAPPTTYKERAQGRSQSPMGERKAYKMNVPASNPLVSAFDELPVVPSPHLLRKSGTFTSLDFAPPQRVFRDNDTMSDAGSIRSNRSGISTAQLQAIRGGAHRVSRLPGDQVFTKDDMANVLKPTWGQRDKQ